MLQQLEWSNFFCIAPIIFGQAFGRRAWEDVLTGCTSILGRCGNVHQMVDAAEYTDAIWQAYQSYFL